MISDNIVTGDKGYSDIPDSASNFDYNPYTSYERSDQRRVEPMNNKYENFKPYTREIKNERQQLVDENFLNNQKERFEYVDKILSPKDGPTRSDPVAHIAAQKYEQQFEKLGNRKNNASNFILSDGSEADKRKKGVQNSQQMIMPPEDISATGDQPKKMTTNNQVYKPTNNLLTWEEAPPVDKKKRKGNNYIF